MDIRALLEKMYKFAGSTDQKQGPAGQLRGSNKMPKKGGKHPAYHKLVGDSVEPEGNMLEDLAQEAQDKSIEWKLAEAWAEFKEEAFKDTADKRPARAGSRPDREYTSDDKPSKRYKKVGEGECIDKEKITKFHSKLDDLVHSTFGKRPGEMQESAAELNVGDDVIITGPVEHQGETGVIDSFGKDKSFVVVNLYNHGKQSFNSSDVSYNDYADSDAEEAEMYDRDPDFRKWADTQVDEGFFGDLKKSINTGYATGLRKGLRRTIKPEYHDEYGIDSVLTKDQAVEILKAAKANGHLIPKTEGWESGPEERDSYEPDPDYGYDEKRQRELDAKADAENARRPQQKIYTLLGRGPNMEPNYKFPGEYTSQEDAIAARAKLMADPRTPNPNMIGIHSYTKYLDESQGDPHKILLNKLRDIERGNNPTVPSADDDARRAEQGKEDYRKYVEKMKKKDPNFVPLYKMDEYGAAGGASAAKTTSTSTTPTATSSPEEKQKAAKMAQAATTVKSAIGTTAPTTSVVKALDTATQGKTVGSQDMKILEPMMKDMATVAQEPRLANQFKTLVNQINQTQRQQNK